jgi:hypothetical protein
MGSGRVFGCIRQTKVKGEQNAALTLCRGRNDWIRLRKEAFVRDCRWRMSQRRKIRLEMTGKVLVKLELQTANFQMFS